MENVGARGTDVSRNSSPQKKQDRFLRSNNTLSSREEDVSKGAKPTERGIVLCSRRLHLPLLWIRVTPGLGLHSQPIIRSRDNNYLKKKKKKNVDLAHSRSTTPPPPPLPSLLSHLPGILLQKQIKRRRETAIVFASAVENKRNNHGWWFRVLV